MWIHWKGYPPDDLIQSYGIHGRPIRHRRTGETGAGNDPMVEDDDDDDDGDNDGNAAAITRAEADNANI